MSSYSSLSNLNTVQFSSILYQFEKYIALLNIFYKRILTLLLIQEEAVEVEKIFLGIISTPE